MIKAQLFSTNRLVARAVFVGQRINTHSLEKYQRLSPSPLTLKAGDNGMAVLFRFGAIVVFGISPEEEMYFLESISPFIVQPLPKIEVEEVILEQTPDQEDTIEPTGILLKDFNISRLQIIASVLAKSVVQAHYEITLTNTFDRIEPLASKLQSGHFPRRRKELLQHIGDTIMTLVKTVGRVEVGEKPDLLWDQPEFERLYKHLADYYELEDRQTAIERKLNLISSTAETLLDLLQNKQSLRVEWYIVILILFDIFVSLYEMWFT